MDISQLVIVAVAVAGAVIVGLLAIVPTMLELPRRRDSADRPQPPTDLPEANADSRRSTDHKLAA